MARTNLTEKTQPELSSRKKRRRYFLLPKSIRRFIGTDTGRLLGIIGIFFGTLMLSVVIGVFVKVAVADDVLNPFLASSGLPTVPPPNVTPNPEFQGFSIDLGNTAKKWQGKEPVVILLMGADTRPSERGNWRPRSDTMMLLMVDPAKNRASVLSIPRDLYVDIPGYGLYRINTAYFLGDGPLAVKTVEYNLGIRVNYYILVEFDVFTTIVDEIGGVDVYVPKTIYDANYPDMNYGYDPFYIEQGQHHMDGATALKYSRTRHTDSDFNRARRQQDVMFAIREKVLSTGTLPTLIQRAPALYDRVRSGVYTNMTLDEMTALAWLVQDIEKEDIRTGVIGPEHTTGHLTEQGAQVLLPRRQEIATYLEYIFWLNE